MAFPEPRLALAVVVDEATRETATYTVTNAKGTPATLDPGDGTEPLSVVITGGTGTARHQYAVPGHHTYTATVTAPCPQRYADWTALPAALATWTDVPGDIATWADTDRTTETTTAVVTVDVGKATIVATPYPAPIPLCQVDVWIGAPETVKRWTVTRSVPASEPPLNAAIWITSDNPSGYSLDDREAPLGVPIVYVLEVEYTDGTTFTATSDPVSIDDTRGCWLTSTVTGQTVPVTVVAWDTRTRDARVTYLAVAGRPDPVALSDTHLWPSGTWVLRTATKAELDDVLSILLSRLVLLRTQPASSLRTVYASVGRVEEARAFVGDGSVWVMGLTIDIQEVAPIPATARNTTSTWAVVANQWQTWADLAAAMPTWQDVAQWRPAAVSNAESRPAER